MVHAYASVLRSNARVEGIEIMKAKVLKTMDGDILFIRLTPFGTNTPIIFFGRSIISISPTLVDGSEDEPLAVLSFLTGGIITMRNTYKEVMDEIGIHKYFGD